MHDQHEGNNIQALEEADIAKAEALVCVTDSDELNMIICGLAASRYPELTRVARVRNDEYVRFRRAGTQGGGINQGAPGDVLAFPWWITGRSAPGKTW
jgi:trk system potassium uptake protein TrkA